MNTALEVTIIYQYPIIPGLAPATLIPLQSDCLVVNLAGRFYLKAKAVKTIQLFIKSLPGPCTLQVKQKHGYVAHVDEKTQHVHRCRACVLWLAHIIYIRNS